MGVTLERVQNKFACIIGELCSEPDILSQFAIWVDMRIAEYKTKGTISLDCTGTTPHPTWLKGLKVSIQPNTLSHRGPTLISNDNARHRRHRIVMSESPPGGPMRHQEEGNITLDVEDNSDIVVVKDEPLEVFPVSLHHHERNPRKRTHTAEADILNSDNSIFPPTSPSKFRRLSAAGDHLSTMQQDSVSNQSFMSVIGLSDQPSPSDRDQMLHTPNPLRTAVSDFDSSRGDHSSELASDSGFNVQGPTLDGSHSVSDKDGDDIQDMSNVNFGASPLMNDPTRPLGTNTNPAHVTLFPGQPQSRNTAVNTRSAVSIFERWVQQLPHREMRRIEKIPPEDLDNYLAIFWSTIRRQDGADYHPKSLSQLRTRLECHLRNCGYPVSIVSENPRFGKSVRAYKERMSFLQLTNS